MVHGSIRYVFPLPLPLHLLLQVRSRWAVPGLQAGHGVEETLQEDADPKIAPDRHPLDRLNEQHLLPLRPRPR